MGLHLRLATTADSDAIGSVSAAAFDPTTDAITSRLFPPHLQPQDVPVTEAIQLWRQARKSIKLGDGRINIVVATDDALDGQVVAFALWEIPAQSPHDPDVKPSYIPSPMMDQHAFDELQSILGADIKHNFGDRGTNDLWHLDYLAVDPQQQRRGIGKLLLNWGIEKAREQGRDCYLVATPAGRTLYEAAGFEVLQELSIFEVPHLSMILRNPKTA